MHRPGRQQQLNEKRHLRGLEAAANHSSRERQGPGFDKDIRMLLDDRDSLIHILGVMLLACTLSLGSARKLVGQPPGKPIESAQVPHLIQQLSSPKFTERESASSQLKMAGANSISELIKAAQGSNPEVIARAIDILSYLYESPDAAVSLEADRALELLLNEGPAAASQRTEDAFAFDLAAARRRNAILAIQSQGGILVPKVVPDDDGKKISLDLSEPDSIQHAILGRKWRGELSSLKYFDRLRPELHTIYITSDASLTPEVIGLYSKALEPARVELRGGFLGVSSGPTFDPSRCDIDATTLNSPAEQAGLKKGDWLTHLDGLPIHGFTGLTSMLLSRKGGETILLDVAREPDEEGAQFLELEIFVTLGEWGAQPAASKNPPGGTPKANAERDRDALPKPKSDVTPGPPQSAGSPGKSSPPQVRPKK